MTINSAMVGASGINWLYSRGDIVLAFKAKGQGFESHPGKLFQFFFAFISYFFSKKILKLILKSFFTYMNTYQSNFNVIYYDIRLFEHFDFSQNTVYCRVAHFQSIIR